MAILSSRHDAWRLLYFRMKNYCFNLRRDLDAEKRGGGRVLSEASLSQMQVSRQPLGLDCFPALEPEVFNTLESLHAELLNCLSDRRHRSIAAALLEGCTVAEIAIAEEISVATVNRRIARIREIWRQKID